MKLTKRVWLSMLAVTASAIIGLAQNFTVGPLTYNYNPTNNPDYYGLYGLSQAATADITVPASVSYNGKERPVSVLISYCLVYGQNGNQNFDSSFLKSVTVEEGAEPLKVKSESIEGWTALTRIDLPANTASISTDFIKELPALQSLTLRAETLVEITDNYMTSGINSNAILYVPAGVVDTYKSLRDDAATATPVATLLKAFQDIRAIDSEPQEPTGVIIHNVHRTIILNDATAGSRIGFTSDTGKPVTSFTVDGQDGLTSLGDEKIYTVPSFDTATHLTVEYQGDRGGMTAVPAVTAQRAGIRVTDHGFTVSEEIYGQIRVYRADGSLLLSTQRRHVPLAPGIYIVVINNQAVKIKIG